jgi:hypothetical protein
VTFLQATLLAEMVLIGFFATSLVFPPNSGFKLFAHF